MKLKALLFFLLLLSFPIIKISAQTFDGEWSVDYATIDDRPNGTSYNTIDVGVISENTFVALVRRTGVNYLVGYSNADSVNGRLGIYGYGSELAGYHQDWASGFDLVTMENAVGLAATPDSLVYVANNDVDQGRNILVFKLTADSVISSDYRISTGEDSLWAIDLDGSGHVFVTSIKAGAPGSVMVYNSIANAENDWSSAHASTPLTTVTVPDSGELRGVAVNNEGTMLFVSNYSLKKVYCYLGDPMNGYTLNSNFNLDFSDSQAASDSVSTLDPGPWGLKYMDTKNILFMAADVSFQLGTGYEYAKIFLVNPNNGEYLDTINVAQWNFDQTGAYNSRPGGTKGNVSGYSSTYGVDVDENFNVYSQSYYGWTVEKWSYSGTLPTIELTGVEKIDNNIPTKFSLKQNYPNPFNPSTTIEFSVNKESEVSLKIYSITGQLVEDLLQSKTLSSGNYKVKFDASKLASGTYIYTLKNGNQQISKKMILLK